MESVRQPADWKVLLIGGHSCTGKTTVARTLASRWKIPFADVDDFRLVLQRVTGPEEQPVLHAFKTWSDVEGLSAEKVCQRPRGDFTSLPIEEQQRRISASRLYGQWLGTEARRHGLPMIRPHPWDTRAGRILAKLEGDQEAG